MMEIMSQFTVFLTGEHLYSGYFINDTQWLPPENDRLYYYSYSLPMERVKGEFFHRQWGAVIAWLPCMKNQRDIMTKVEPTRDLLSRIMHADVIFWPLWCNSNEILKIDNIRRKWDIGNKAVEFIPYWDNRVITTATPDVVISYYDKNGEKLVIVSNLARKAQDVEIKLPACSSVINAENNQAVALKKNNVKLSIKRNDFAILIVKK